MDNLVVLAGIALLIVIFCQQYTIHKLVNKLMSRNFHEYESAVHLTNKETVKFKESDQVPEDLRILQEFSL